MRPAQVILLNLRIIPRKEKSHPRRDSFDVDLTPYFLDEKQTVIKNTSIFDIMVNLLK